MLGGLVGAAGCAPRPSDVLAPPTVRRIALPDFFGSHAIWGATGRDATGAIWCGISADEGDRSAHLVRYDPTTDRAEDRGNVLAQLARLGPRPPGESQVKIHSKILAQPDGSLWFTSTDEDGEAEDGSAPPRWGSHVWSLHPGERDWRHHLAVPEGLTCAAAGGGTVWALGLWDHVLYSLDTRTGQTARRVIGAPGGHMSRNIVADARGHAYVPRVHRAPDGELRAELLEFAPPMRLIAATPLTGYAAGQTPAEAHGIVGLATLANGDLVITTGAGMLHRIALDRNGPSRVTSPGWFHPAGSSYASALFSPDGRDTIAGLARAEPWTWDWVVHDLRGGTSRARRLDLNFERSPLIYGSDVRDNAGRVYVGGRETRAGQRHPILLQITPPA